MLQEHGIWLPNALDILAWASVSDPRLTAGYGHNSAECPVARYLQEVNDAQVIVSLQGMWLETPVTYLEANVPAAILWLIGKMDRDSILAVLPITYGMVVKSLFDAQKHQLDMYEHPHTQFYRTSEVV